MNKVGPGLRASSTVVVTALLLVLAHSTSAQEPPVVGQQQARKIALQRGWPTRQVDDQGGVIELQAIVRGIPRYFTTHNIDAADSVSADECWTGGSGALDLSGAGVTLGIWDGGGVLLTHNEFEGRAFQIDSPSYIHWHSTHVAGTMIGVGAWPGNPDYPPGQSKGMSPSARLDCYEWNSDLEEMAAAAAAGLRASNHSYGYVTGWDYGNYGAGEGWYWFGDVTVSAVEDYYFGRYSFESQAWDQITHDNPWYLPVTSAGNDRNDSGPGAGGGHYFWDPDSGWAWGTDTRSPDGNDGYDCIGHQGIAKNSLAVGAVQDVIGGYAGATGVPMTDFSCWGPADDGRIKPDVVGNGDWLFSAYSSSDGGYALASGTSMSSPNVCGALGLLIQQWRATHPGTGDLRAATLKALVIHTADECGAADGPDYSFGWGLMNTLHAVQTIATDATETETISEWWLPDGGNTFAMQITTDGTSDELRATLCWTEPPSAPPEHTLDNPARMLINDLDLRIVSASGAVALPWVLDPANPSTPATTGDNDRDNVEQVVLPNPGIGAYTLHVSHKGTLQDATQAFSLIITGAASIEGPADCNGNAMADTDEISAGVAADCNANVVPDDCDLDPSDPDGDGDVSTDCNANGLPDECDLDPDDPDGNGRVSADCNANTIPDECDPDLDADGVTDDCDNCPDTANLEQTDADEDGVGDLCDNCPDLVNSAQLDADLDGVGDLCDNCPDVLNVDQIDTDGDGYGDLCDNCPDFHNLDRADEDGDGIGNVCDNCLYVFNPDQIDTDGDGTGDACDNCPDPNPYQEDRDDDGVGDLCDNCPDTPNPDQLDTDGDGIGDACQPAPETPDPPASAPETDGDPIDPPSPADGEQDAQLDDTTQVEQPAPETAPINLCGFGTANALPLTMCGLVWMKFSPVRRRRRS